MTVNSAAWLKNKRVLVFGLGVHGGGLTLANWLQRQGAKVTVTDKKTAAVLKPSIKQLIIPSKNIILGQEPKLGLLSKIDLIIQNPGVPNNHFFLQAAKAKGILIYNEATLFFLLVNQPILAITGSKGKSTTTHLLGEICSKFYPDTLVGGNIKIKTMFGFIDQIKPRTKVILELSSWQLEGLKIIKKSPQISLLTNITPEHLNRYKNFNEYIAAKFFIFKYQTKNDIAILNQNDPVSRQLAKKIISKKYWYSLKFRVNRGVYIKQGGIYFRNNGSDEFIIAKNKIKLAGEHNLANTLAAILAAKILQVPNKIISQVVSRYHGFSSRLETVRKIRGITFINDTTATAPVATIAALQTIKKNIILLAGGSSKKLPVELLAKEIKSKVKYCLLFAGEGSDELLLALEKNHYKKSKLFTNFQNMSDLVATAVKLAKTGDTILLSPGFASFANFKNEFDRGEQFNKIVKKLK